MTKLYVLFENPDWMPPLEDALREAKIPYETWHMHNRTFDLSSVPPEGVFLNRMSPSSHTRGHHASVDITREMIFWLEAHGRKVINGSSAFSFEISKIKQYAALGAAGLKVPRTIAVSGQKKEILQASRQIPAPFILKHNRGGKGAGVQLFSTHESLEQTLSNDETFTRPMDHIFLIQEYIKPRDASITRVEIVGGKFLYAIRVSVEKGFELCPAEACDVGDLFCPTTDDTNPETSSNRQSLFSLRENFSDPVIEQYLSLMKNHKIDIAGIEFIENEKGEKFTYDINCTTNYSPGVEQKHGLSGMSKIAALAKKWLGNI